MDRSLKLADFPGWKLNGPYAIRNDTHYVLRFDRCNPVRYEAWRARTATAPMKHLGDKATPEEAVAVCELDSKQPQLPLNGG